MVPSRGSDDENLAALKLQQGYQEHSPLLPYVSWYLFRLLVKEKDEVVSNWTNEIRL